MSTIYTLNFINRGATRNCYYAVLVLMSFLDFVTVSRILVGLGGRND